MAHITEIRIRGYHLDLYGHVTNARYLEFLEEARWTLLEDHIDLDDWLARGMVFIVAKVEISYRKPVTVGHTLEIHSSVGRIGGRSAVIHQECRIRGDDEPAAEADVTFVVRDRDSGRLLGFDGELRDAFVDMVDGPEA